MIILTPYGGELSMSGFSVGRADFLLKKAGADRGMEKPDPDMDPNCNPMTLSRDHTRFARSGNGKCLTIKDCESQLGTWVDGRKITLITIPEDSLSQTVVSLDRRGCFCVRFLPIEQYVVLRGGEQIDAGQLNPGQAVYVMHLGWRKHHPRALVQMVFPEGDNGPTIVPRGYDAPTPVPPGA